MKHDVQCIGEGILINEKNRVYFCIALIVTLVFLIFRPIKVPIKVIDREDVILDVYECELRDLEGNIFANNGMDYSNPWIMGANGIHYIRNNELSKAEIIMNNLMSCFYKNGAFPRDEYQSFAYGWVSCMDAPTVCVMAQMMFEKTGDKKYREFVGDLIPYMLSKSKTGGTS